MSEPRKIFLDCGSHYLEGLTDLVISGAVTDDFEMHTFEANPACMIRERVAASPFNELVTVHEKAVWIDSNGVDFFQENHAASGSNSPWDGKTEIDGHGSSVSDVNFVHGGYSKPIRIPSVDFPAFVEQFKDCFVVCKMDIEGSEYPVLRKLIDTGAIGIIDILYVEFHHRFVEAESAESEAELISQIKSLGVEVNTWW